MIYSSLLSSWGKKSLLLYYMHVDDSSGTSGVNDGMYDEGSCVHIGINRSNGGSEFLSDSLSYSTLFTFFNYPSSSIHTWTPFIDDFYPSSPLLRHVLVQYYIHICDKGIALSMDHKDEKDMHSLVASSIHFYSR
jgi:hypothetical protein